MLRKKRFTCYAHIPRNTSNLEKNGVTMERFLEKAKEYNLKKHINVKAKKIDLKIISDYRADDIDTLAGTRIVGDRPIQLQEKAVLKHKRFCG